MRPRTVLALVVVLGGLVGVAYVGLSGGGGDLSVTWTSDTAVAKGGNHHEPAVATVDGQALVFAPLSSTRDLDQCALVALSAETGDERWRYRIPQEHCTIHSVADPAVADGDGDGDTEVLAATTEQEVVAFTPTSGSVERRYPLSAYGYTTPIVADVAGGSEPELLVVDVNGFVQAFDREGEVVWSVNRSTYVWATPAVADLDGDGQTEVAVGGRDGLLASYGANGSEEWETRVDESMTWLTTGQLDEDDALELVAGTQGGSVVVWDGAAGEREWVYGLPILSAVHAVGEVDGQPTVFATAGDGSLVALDGESGGVRWETTVTTEQVQMMPPPVLGDVTGDGDEELVVAANDGTVSVLDPATGDVLASHERDVDVLAHPVLADADGDGTKEIYLIYADGRVQRLEYDA
ncbi:PQQ-binding-like beta-propeller repeat protein [Haloarchaeobius sp. TZWWS8]|uniref:outer membrane protein assembly factor BamB family protein n=1 Tax=Haloarchaeobius sp. TZWWS8 TaxID=3446121 RepID=UPI003EB6A0E2